MNTEDKHKEIETTECMSPVFNDPDNTQCTAQLPDDQLVVTNNEDMSEYSSDSEDSDDEDPVAEAPPKRVAVKLALGTNFLEHLQKLHAELKDSPEELAQTLYRKQAIHDHTCLVGYKSKARKVPVYIADEVSESWRKSVKKAITDIRIAAPGINMYIVKRKRKAIILIDHYAKRDPNQAFAVDDIWELTKPDGTIWVPGIARIHLGKNYARNLVDKHMDWFKPGTTPQEAEEQTMLTTCIHELIHALGFCHEHQTERGAEEVDTSSAGYSSSQVEVLDEFISLTRFDPHSIMLYPELVIKGNNPGTAMTTDSQRTSYNLVMSELDKVALNMIYPPRKHSGRWGRSAYKYEPKQFECAGTNMFYCFREVMESHNNPYYKISNGICGGERSNPGGPNCPACRTLKCERSFLNDKRVRRWQGWSGMIYCGRTKYHPCGHSCGSDTGYPCIECKALIDPK